MTKAGEGSSEYPRSQTNKKLTFLCFWELLEFSLFVFGISPLEFFPAPPAAFFDERQLDDNQSAVEARAWTTFAAKENPLKSHPSSGVYLGSNNPFTG